MDNPQQVLNHFLFRGKLFLIEDQQFCPVLGTEPPEPRKAETNQPILVSDNEVRHLSRLDAIHQRNKLRPLEIQSPANLFDKFDVCDPARCTEIF